MTKQTTSNPRSFICSQALDKNIIDLSHLSKISIQTQKKTFNDKILWITREDLIGPYINGNKAYKFYWLIKKEQTPLFWSSYGGVQSNALRALAFIAYAKKKELHYFTRPIAPWLKISPKGNYAKALELGVFFHETEDPQVKAQDFALTQGLYIPQGGHDTRAEAGLKILAKKLKNLILHERLASEKTCIYLPSGMGTCAHYLSKWSGIPVITFPTAGSKSELLASIKQLGKRCKHVPKIIDSVKKYHFAHLYAEFFDLYKQSQKTLNIEFDLIYDMKAFLLLQTMPDYFPEHIIYPHGGGVEGNVTMIARYERKLRGQGL